MPFVKLYVSFGCVLKNIDHCVNDTDNVCGICSGAFVDSDLFLSMKGT